MPAAAPAVRPLNIDPNRLYKYDEIADIMAVTPWHVRNMVREGRIGYVKTGPQRGHRISGRNYLDYLAANTVEPASF